MSTNTLMVKTSEGASWNDPAIWTGGVPLDALNAGALLSQAYATALPPAPSIALLNLTYPEAAIINTGTPKLDIVAETGITVTIKWNGRAEGSAQTDLRRA